MHHKMFLLKLVNNAYITRTRVKTAFQKEIKMYERRLELLAVYYLFFLLRISFASHKFLTIKRTF